MIMENNKKMKFATRLWLMLFISISFGFFFVMLFVQGMDASLYDTTKPMASMIICPIYVVAYIMSSISDGKDLIRYVVVIAILDIISTLCLVLL